MKRSSFWYLGLMFLVIVALASCKKKINIENITQKTWFLRTYERWDTDSRDNVIPESRRSWTYYGDEGSENWFFYFNENNTGYQYHTFQGDTVVYAYRYQYYPEGDSLIIFENENDSVEDYHATIHELTKNNFSFSDEYRPHQFEKLNLVNVTASKRTEPSLHPKKLAKKPTGALIQTK